MLCSHALICPRKQSGIVTAIRRICLSGAVARDAEASLFQADWAGQAILGNRIEEQQQFLSLQITSRRPACRACPICIAEK